MKLLVTGAACFSQQQLDILKDSFGFDVVLQKDERGAPETDFSKVDAAVLNGLFLYHGIDEFEKLKFIQLTSVGFDRVPLDKINEKGISLYNARGVYSVPMAEFALAGVLNLYKNANGFYENKKKHLWQKNRQIRELCGSTVCVVGCGSVGTECAKRFKAFGTRVIGVDLYKPSADTYDAYYDIKSIKDALSVSNVIVITLPLTQETKGLFNEEMLLSCRQGAVIVNISRGPVLDENALCDLIESGHIGGAVLDVFETEPLNENSRLWDYDNVIITPHNSFVSDKNNDRLFELCCNNLKGFLKEENK